MRTDEGALESSVVSWVLSYLRRRGDIFFWRHNVSVANFGGRVVRSSRRGVSDVLCCWAPSGRFVGIECKREKGGALDADQRKFRDTVVMHGGLYIEARCEADIEAVLGRPTVKVRQPPTRKRAYSR